jgi:hypothetical protein
MSAALELGQRVGQAVACRALGVTKTHSRSHVSDDNPYSESQFKTLMPGSPRTGLRPWGGSSTGPSFRNASAPSRTHAPRACY